jgi:hypothetical protein
MKLPIEIGEVYGKLWVVAFREDEYRYECLCGAVGWMSGIDILTRRECGRCEARESSHWETAPGRTPYPKLEVSDYAYQRKGLSGEPGESDKHRQRIRPHRKRETMVSGEGDSGTPESSSDSTSGKKEDQQ